MDQNVCVCHFLVEAPFLPFTRKTAIISPPPLTGSYWKWTKRRRLGHWHVCACVTGPFVFTAATHIFMSSSLTRPGYSNTCFNTSAGCRGKRKRTGIHIVSSLIDLSEHLTLSTTYSWSASIWSASSITHFPAEWTSGTMWVKCPAQGYFADLRTQGSGHRAST